MQRPFPEAMRASDVALTGDHEPWEASLGDWESAFEFEPAELEPVVRQAATVTRVARRVDRRFSMLACLLACLLTCLLA